jgi:NitT/TauT family transport system substrate-binding protein
MGLTRRQFGKAVGAAALGVAWRPPRARAALPAMRFGNGAGVTDSQLCFISVGKHPKLGFYKEEGVEAEIINMSSASQTVQAVATGSVEYGALSPVSYLPLFAKNPSLEVVSAYVFLPQTHVLVGVKPDGAVQSIADLKGKNIGIRNQGDTGYFALQAMFKSLGIDPQNDVQWTSVGGGGPAGQALYSGKIDAIAIWDAELARVEVAGFKLRYLPNTPEQQRALGAAFGVNRSALKADRRRYVGLFRGVAKSTVFARANPELAIRLHWELYPESKPKGKSEEDAMREALYVINVRKEKWFPGPFQKDKRIGGSTLEDWQGMVQYVGRLNPQVPAAIKDPSALFTDELIDEVNQFDRAAIERMAQTLTL